MTQKRTYTPKPKPIPEGYVFAAKDGDGDGMVQDGTEFERPVGTEFFAEELELVSEPVKEVPATHTLQEGENILTVAANYLPEGKTRSEYAKELYALNGDLSVGKVVRLV
jgi:hypothetical protein